MTKDKMNDIQYFINKVKNNPELITFLETIDLIDCKYIFTPTAFKNGSQQNSAGENNGSCKIFAFAKMNNLNKEDTLALFGDYYFKDVLEFPEGNDHQNIRNFITNGWNGISFHQEVLVLK